MTSFASFPALMPLFFNAWQISGTEAGWINGIFFCGFMLCGPALISLTDRMDARPIFLTGTVMSFIGAVGFAWLARDFWSSLPWRFISGAGLAAIYMPGLKLLTDRLPPGDQSRSIAFYTACFSAGSALSFLLVGQVQVWFGWKQALISVCLGPPLAFSLVYFLTDGKKHQAPRHWKHLLNYGPVLKNRQTMAYVIAYGAHTWELMTMRSFLVAFLFFSRDLTHGPAWMDTGIIAAVIIFIGLPASVLGNELALKVGRARAITLIMISSTIVASLLGFSAPLPFWAVVILITVYGVTVTADSASLTAGAVQSASDEMRGATMAVHSSFGFAGAMAGPIIAGIVLDWGGGQNSVDGWGYAFMSAGLVALLGPVSLKLLASNPGQASL